MLFRVIINSLLFSSILATSQSLPSELSSDNQNNPIAPLPLVRSSLSTTIREIQKNRVSNFEPLKKKQKKSNKFDNAVLLVRHGEKDKDGSIGLNKDGKQRAQCFRKIFGKESKYDIGLIIVENYDKQTGKKRRPYDTVKYLAKDLGLKVNVDCEVNDEDCVRKLITKFAKKSNKDILVCWKHSQLNIIAEELGARANKSYPDERFDILWTLQNERIVSKSSEKCAGIDHARRQPDLDLVIEEEDDSESVMRDSSTRDQLLFGQGLI